jgi:hypothetical protein
MRAGRAYMESEDVLFEAYVRDRKTYMEKRRAAAEGLMEWVSANRPTTADAETAAARHWQAAWEDWYGFSHGVDTMRELMTVVPPSSALFLSKFSRARSRDRHPTLNNNKNITARLTKKRRRHACVAFIVIILSMFRVEDRPKRARPAAHGAHIAALASSSSRLRFSEKRGGPRRARGWRSRRAARGGGRCGRRGRRGGA